MTYRAIAAAAALACFATAGTAIAQDGALQFKGNWRWANNGRPTPAKFEIYPEMPGEGAYCYGSVTSKGATPNCFDVRFTMQGSTYAFSFNGTNWFTMTSPEPGVMTGKYWSNKANRTKAPDATITMQQTQGRY